MAITEHAHENRMPFVGKSLVLVEMTQTLYVCVEIETEQEEERAKL